MCASSVQKPRPNTGESHKNQPIKLKPSSVAWIQLPYGLKKSVHKGGNIEILPGFDDEIILGWKSFAIDPENNGETQVFCIFGDYELV